MCEFGGVGMYVYLWALAMGLPQGLPGRGPGQWGAGHQTFAVMCPTASSSGWALPPSSLLQLLTLNCGHPQLY